MNNIDIKNLPSNTILKLPKTSVDIIADGQSFSGTAVSENIRIINSSFDLINPSDSPFKYTLYTVCGFVNKTGVNASEKGNNNILIINKIDNRILYLTLLSSFEFIKHLISYLINQYNTSRYYTS